MDEDLSSPSFGGSEGTTVNVFRQFGQRKQFRAHLPSLVSPHARRLHVRSSPVLLRAYARAGHLEEAVRTVVSAHFDHHAAVAAHGIAFFAEEEVVQWVEAVG